MVSAPLRTTATWLTGQVVSFHPETHTYTVTADNRVLQGVQRLVDHPGDICGLPKNTLVAMHRELGFWAIAGVINQRAAGQPEISALRVTELQGQGAQDPGELLPAIGDGRAPNAPTDVAEGDWVQHGDLGQLLALLRGGSVVLKGSPLAQLRAHGQNDLVEIVSHLFRHITAMGEAQVTSDAGKLRYSWRGAANYEDANPASEKWTIHLDVGATPTGDIFTFAITTNEGRVLARIAMTPGGKLELRGTELEVTTGSSDELYDGDRSTTVTGNRDDSVEQDRAEATLGSNKQTVSKNLDQTIGGNRSVVVGGSDNALLSGVSRRKILGGLVPTPGAKSEVTEHVNGSVEVSIGNPLSGALPAALQGAQWVSYVGGYQFVLQPSSLPAPLGGFNVMSVLPASINLGCDGIAAPDPTSGGHLVAPVPAPFGVMKFEPFLAMMQVFLTLLDTHVHSTAVGPSSPPVVPLTPTLSPLLPLIRSLRVGVGL